MQILLPLAALSDARYASLARELTEKFGGLTSFSRAPADGLWKDASDDTVRDDVVVLEVMVAALDRAWWSAFRSRLERQFAQDEVLIRAQETERL